jgi:acetoin utilization deacetylase AcuC-like enzyme
VDWDVHHGNGTQEMFYADPSVLFISLHQFPMYPGTGDVEEIGEDDGRGRTVNVPLPSGATDSVYEAAFERIVLPILAQFAPGLVLVSSGFDAHARDPLAEMQLTERGFARMAEGLTQAVSCPVGIVLEGGYDLTALEASTAAVTEVLLGSAPSGMPHERPPQSAPALPLAQEQQLDRVLRCHSAYWKF